MGLYASASRSDFLNDIGPEWRVGQKVPKIYSNFIPEIVQADCDELTWILQNFNNLPCPKNAAVVRWYGGMAQMIWDALPKSF